MNVLCYHTYVKGNGQILSPYACDLKQGATNDVEQYNGKKYCSMIEQLKNPRCIRQESDKRSQYGIKDNLVRSIIGEVYDRV